MRKLCADLIDDQSMLILIVLFACHFPLFPGDIDSSWRFNWEASVIELLGWPVILFWLEFHILIPDILI